ncbi:MAG: hypothetical protein J6N45_09965 [Alphaproteobacteria bacterium]|nr:hypothetical protein [Alphaproteobacteria bacterium]
MEENQNTNQPRKIRKIKRVRPIESKSGSFGMPSKINAVTSQESAFGNSSSAHEENYFANNGEAESIRFVTEEDIQPAETITLTYLLKNKTVLLLVALSALIGVMLGSIFFSSKKTASRGLDGVVINSDVPAGRNRCGLVEQHQGCVLYIMNPHTQEVTGKDFYSTAAQWTQRQRYLIETGNMHYSNTRIKPGYIAQINIPPLSSY